MVALWIVASLVSSVSSPARAGSVLDGVKASQTVSCGIIIEEEDWNKEDLHGSLSALEAEVCKAITVAVLGDAAKAKTRLYAVEQDACEGLKKGEPDVVAGVTPSAANLAFYGVAFGPPIFYDAQGFMVHKHSGIGSLAGLSHRKVCFIDGTENGPVLFANMKAGGITFIPFPFQEEGEMDAALVDGHCDAVTADISSSLKCARNFTAWSMIS
jgi:general L-amino acid transport system substrate-binding protein